MDDKDSPPAAASFPSDTGHEMPSPIDVDDLLTEILLRLAPLPSSLPRASLVCTRWRRLVTDPEFLRRFRAHHSVSSHSGRKDFSFSFISDPGDSIRHDRFSVPPVRAGGGDDYTCMDGNMKMESELSEIRIR
ncbi:unnamed protein product [Urochloa humidicola]